MPGDWREEPVDDPQVDALDHAEGRRHWQLSTDPMFVLRTEALKRQLEKHYAQHPEIVADFFRQFSWPIAPKLKRLNAFLRNTRDAALRKTLRKYVKHANRFRVVFVSRKQSPHFETIELLPGATKFHVKIVDGQLAPISPADADDPIDISFASDEVEVPRPIARPIKRGHAGYVRVHDCPVAEDDLTEDSLASVRVEDCPIAEQDPIEVSFASEQVEVPRPLAQAIKRGQANFMRIDDKEGSSCLSILEHVAYFPEGITFVLHDAEQPYLLCLIGEKVSVELWRKLSTTVTAMLRKKFGRGKAGRPKDLKKRRQAKKLLERPGPIKEKASRLAGNAPNIATQQSYLSRLRKELKQ